MARLRIWPWLLARTKEGMPRRGVLETIFYAVGLVLTVIAVIAVAIIVSDIIYFLFDYFIQNGRPFSGWGTGR